MQKNMDFEHPIKLLHAPKMFLQKGGVSQI